LRICAFGDFGDFGAQEGTCSFLRKCANAQKENTLSVSSLRVGAADMSLGIKELDEKTPHLDRERLTSIGDILAALDFVNYVLDLGR
jgi:hypothetical protein